MRSLRNHTLVLASVAALGAAAGCGDLDVTNPNLPDRNRVLSTPGDVISLAGSGLVPWYNANHEMVSAGPLNTMADAYSASWNNYQMRIFSSEPRTHWRNDPAAAERLTVEQLWYDSYSTLAGANDVLRTIAGGTLNFPDSAQMRMAQTISTLMQGLTLGDLALNYDKAFFVDENISPDQLASLAFLPRAEIRDSAVSKLEAAIALAEANSFTTNAEWTGGEAYSNEQIAQIANTAAARVLAYFPRNAAENAAVDWARVRDFAAEGLSKPGAEFDFVFVSDGNCPDINGAEGICDALKLWSNDPTTMRVDTRVANMLDPGTQATPWPFPDGNPVPNSPDRRLGDGSIGPDGPIAYDGTQGDDVWADGVNGYWSATGNPGTDFMWNSDAIMNPSRGSYHQSNITHVRYMHLGFSDPRGVFTGPAPIMTAAENDLLWADALIHLNQLDLAAEKINNTRVDRGGLSAAAAGDGVAGLNTKLYYEQDIELLGLASVPFYNRRRIDGLQPMTPREMPVPAKELGVLRQELYTFGGTFPLQSETSASFSTSRRVKNVHEISREIRQRSRPLSRHM